MFFEVEFDDMVDYIYSKMTLDGIVITRDIIIKMLDYETEFILENGDMGE